MTERGEALEGFTYFARVSEARVQWLLSRGLATSDALNEELKGACRADQRELVEIMFSLGATCVEAGLSSACHDNFFHLACHFGNLDVARWIFEQAAVKTVWATCAAGRFELAQLLLESGADATQVLPRSKTAALWLAARGGRLDHFIGKLQATDLLQLHRQGVTDFGRHSDMMTRYRAVVRGLLLRLLAAPRADCVLLF